MFYLAIAAAVICAICNGIAAILQKISASRAKQAKKLDVGLLWRLVRNPLYAGGVMLDVVAGGAQLVGVRYAPLFLVQSIIAASVVITALIDRLILKHRMAPATYIAVILVLCGLVLLSLAAHPSTTAHISTHTKWSIILGPIPLALIGALFARKDTTPTNVGLALVSGLAFGGTSIVGRVLILQGGLLRILIEPLTWALVAYGVLGLLLFTLAVQRGSATIMNAALVATQTVLPTVVGFWLLGDHASGSTMALVIAGCTVTLVGTFSVMGTHREVL